MTKTVKHFKCVLVSIRLYIKMQRPTVRDLFWCLMLNDHNPVIEQKFKSPGWQVPKRDVKLTILESKLLDICYEHVKILYFLSQVSTCPLSSQFVQMGGKSIKNGFFLSAFVDGVFKVKEKFLTDFEVIKENYVKNPIITHHEDIHTLTIMHIFYSEINYLIQEIIDRELEGCQILDLILKKEYLATAIAEPMQRLVKCMEAVLVKHIQLWILFGELDDPHHEFFIIKNDKSPDEETCYDPLSLSCASGSSSFSEFGTSMMASTVTNLPFSIEPTEDNSVYDINAKNVPAYLPYSLVSKILSVGNILILLKHAPMDDRDDPFGFVQIDNYGLCEKDMLKKMMSLLNGEKFDPYILEEIVDEIWLGLNKYLKNVACDVGGLRKQYENITDIYIMGRGDLFKEFIKSAGYLLQCDASTVRSRSLNAALEYAADDLYGSSKLFDRFAFTLPPKHRRPKGVKTIDVVKMTYNTVWPCHLIFTNEVMDSYNVIFRFLLNLKSVHTEILQVYHHLKLSSQEESQGPEIRLHHLLDNVLVNLQGYIFIDVILSEKSKFEEVLNSSESFHEIQKAHDIFLSNILNQMFLTASELPDGQTSFVGRKQSLVQEELRKLFSLSSRFCKLLSCYELDDSFRNNTFIEMLNGAEHLVMGILALVDTIHEKYSAEHLSRLVVRLDYNCFFSKRILAAEESPTSEENSFLSDEK